STRSIRRSSGSTSSATHLLNCLPAISQRSRTHSASAATTPSWRSAPSETEDAPRASDTHAASAGPDGERSRSGPLEGVSPGSDAGCPPSSGPLSCRWGYRDRGQVLRRTRKGHTRGRKVYPVSMIQSVVATTRTAHTPRRPEGPADSAELRSSADLGQQANRSAFTGVAEGIELLVPGFTERGGHL